MLDIRCSEWRALVGDLHDVIIHQLSTASLQVMGARGAADARQLHQVLDTVGTLTRSAVNDLRLLMRVLHEEVPAHDGAQELSDLAEALSPTQAATRAQLALSEAGVHADIQVPPVADKVPLSVQRTLARGVSAAAGHAVQFAPNGSTTSITIQVTDTEAELAAHCEVGANTATASSRPLLSLAERMRLTGGDMTVRSKESDWYLVMTLPLV